MHLPQSLKNDTKSLIKDGDILLNSIYKGGIQENRDSTQKKDNKD